MPRFKTEEGKQRWLAAMEKRRGEKKQRGGGTSLTAVATIEEPIPMARPVRPGGVTAGVLDALDVAIAELDADRVALERAKEILERR